MSVVAPMAVAIFAVLGAVIKAPGFDAFLVDWGTLLHNLTNTLIVAAYSSGTGYILKNLFTDDNHNFLGIQTKS